MSKKENIIIEEKVVPLEDKGNLISAIDFAVYNGYGVGIAEAVKTLDPIYKSHMYEVEWRKVFRAFMNKPEGVSWRDFYKN